MYFMNSLFVYLLNGKMYCCHVAVFLYGLLMPLLQGFKRETRFTSKCPANEIISKIEEAAKPLGFDVHKKNYKVTEVDQIYFNIEVVVLNLGVVFLSFKECSEKVS